MIAVEAEASSRSMCPEHLKISRRIQSLQLDHTSPTNMSQAESAVLNELSELVEGLSPVERSRLLYHPRLPNILTQPHQLVTSTEANNIPLDQQIIKLFPNTINQPAAEICGARQRNNNISPNNNSNSNRALKLGVVLSGGPAPGGHNVISGLYDYLQSININSELYGFLDGPSGLVDSKYIQITSKLVDSYRNQGGFHMIGSGRTKIETPKQFEATLNTLNKLDLDGLVVVGGDDSNTNAAVIAEYLKAKNVKTCVAGVPKTIDGDLKNDWIETSFGFDSSTKVFSDLVAALCADAISARKTYHICRLMGRSASHITLEVALNTHPNVTLIGEEIAAAKQTLQLITSAVCDVIEKRAERGLYYGVIILPEGLIEFLPDVNVLINELNELLAQPGGLPSNLMHNLSESSAKVFNQLPSSIAQQLLLDRDPHGNVQVSKIESERLLQYTVENELARRKKNGQYKGNSSLVPHFFGYEGRCGLPSNFDCNYCYALGQTAAVLIQNSITGCMAVVRNLTAPPELWSCGGIPLTRMMNIERRSGKDKPVIKKALVELNQRPFLLFQRLRNSWTLRDQYRNPGSIQYYGPHADSLTLTLQIEKWKSDAQKTYKTNTNNDNTTKQSKL
jgi:pyrophosphate--fructose-6-phosphate 1-phosphotransferase